MKITSHGVIANFLWKFAERVSAQLVTLVVSIVLARLLDPEHYGIIGIVNIFIIIANVFVSDGFGNALIQKKDADALDYSSVLYFNLFISGVLYLVLFISAPYIAAFYGEGYELVAPVLRILGLRIILSGINSVQQAYVSRNMIFRKFFLATLLGTIASAIVGITMAYKGFGVWALVAQYLTNTTIDTVVLAISLKKKPLLAFSFSRIKGMLKYGTQILGTGLMITGYQELRALIIGKVYTSSDLAYYDKGRQFPNLIVTNINSSIGSVLFPKMSNEQDDIDKIRFLTRKSIQIGSYVLCPLMLGLLAVADPFIRVILTDKWIQCVPLLQMFCIVYLFQPINTANMQAIKAVGRSDTYLKLETIKKVIELIVLLFVVNISVKAIVISMAVSTTAFTLVNALPNIKWLNYSFREQMLDILPNIALAGVMALSVSFIGLVKLPMILKLALQVVCGGGIYILLSLITKNKQFSEILGIIRSIRKR